MALGACLLAAASLSHASAAGQLPPDAPWRTVESPHLRITYPGHDPRLEPVARHAAARGEVAWALLLDAIGEAPTGKVDVVLTDAVDYTNGSATVYPTNRIVVHARPPAGDPALGYNADWIEFVMVHELAHVFHLDRTGPLGEVIRSVFGRLPYTWPVFPAAGSPRWATEGLAVVAESDATGYGRLHGSWHETVVRTAVLEGGLPPLDRVTSGWAGWPAGETPYIYGSLFLEFMRERWGERVLPALVDESAAAVLPPELLLDRVARSAAGVSFSAAWRAWGRELTARYDTLRAALEARGLTRGERLTEHGRWALFPRFSPDGQLLAYLADDGSSATRLRVIDGVSGQEVWAARRNGQAAAAWLPDGGLLTSQLEFSDPYHILADLWRLEGETARRLTRGSRVQDPDVAPDGTIVAVRNGGGGNALVTGVPGALEPLVAPDPALTWALPRWSPTGEMLAVVRWRAGGRHDLVVLDRAGRERLVVNGEGAFLQAPAWSPDGAWILFTSDRTGIQNVYAVAADGGPLRQVTEVLGGAFHPDVSPDGRWLVYAGYHADGFHLERLPFAPAAWRAPGLPGLPVRRGGQETPRAGAVPGAGGPPVDTLAGASRPYGALRSALPAYWSPVVVDGDRLGYFLGAGTGGRDLVGRHAWSVWAALHPADGLWQGRVAWSWAGLGQPVLTLAGSRDWDWIGRAVLPDSSRRDVLSREDEVSLLLSASRQRWRRILSGAVGPELVRRHRVLERAGDHRLRDPDDTLLGAVARVAYADHQTHPLGISRQDGVTLALLARQRWDTRREPSGGDGYREVQASAAAYLSLGRVGFADAVMALRGSGLYRTGAGARASGVGGAAGEVGIGLGGVEEGGRRLLPVRGFAEGDRFGTRAWTGSAEVRVPLALVGRGPGLFPVFLDRVSASLFMDAGGADCPAVTFACGPAGTLLSAGGELVLDGVVGFRTPLRLRIGAAQPVWGPGTAPVLHVRLGSSF